ncbi:protein kinase [Hanseniaspora uvarum]|nr:protein kinase [Hanseniaspora uvarum]
MFNLIFRSKRSLRTSAILTARVNYSTKNIYEYEDTRIKCHHLIKYIYDYTSNNNTLDINKLWLNYSNNYFIKEKKLDTATNKYNITYNKKSIANSKELDIITVNNILYLLSKRILEFQELKMIILMNYNIFENYNNLIKSFSNTLNVLNKINKDESYDLKTLLDQVLELNNDNLIDLSKGLIKCEEDNWINKMEINSFLNNDIKEMILLKLICKHHSNILSSSEADDMIGIIHSKLNVASLVTHTTEFINDMCFIKYDHTIPIKILKGEDIEFPCVPIILEYIITELLKNSIKAQIENEQFEKPIEITILKNYNEFDNNMELEIRIRDFGNGIPFNIEDKILDFNFSTTTSNELNKAMQDNIMPGEQINNVSGMGYGLGIIRNFVDLINDGNFKLCNLNGYGVDCYIRFKA